jgi:hypothetical protein
LADYGKLTKACPSVTLNPAAVFLGSLSNVIIVENKRLGGRVLLIEQHLLVKCLLFLEVGIKFLNVKSYIRLFQNIIR